MKIRRINGDKSVDIECNIIDLVIDGKRYRLTECFGELGIMGDDALIIHPGVSNTIAIDQKD